MGIEGELLSMYLVSAILMVMGGERRLLNVHLDRLRVKHNDNYAHTCGPLVDPFFSHDVQISLVTYIFYR